MTDWTFKPDHVEYGGSEDFWYAITEGYIDPSNCLTDKTQIKRVEDAVALLQSFSSAAYEAGVLEEC